MLFQVLAALVTSLIGAWWMHRKMIQKLAESHCPQCGRIIGREAIDEARNRYAEEVRELREKNPRVRFRMIARWKLQCRRCDVWLVFNPNKYLAPTELVCEDGTAQK